MASTATGIALQNDDSPIKSLQGFLNIALEITIDRRVYSHWQSNVARGNDAHRFAAFVDEVQRAAGCAAQFVFINRFQPHLADIFIALVAAGLIVAERLLPDLTDVTYDMRSNSPTVIISPRK